MHRTLSLTARRTVAIIAATAAISIGVSACSGTPETEPVTDSSAPTAAAEATATADAMLEAQGLDGLDTRALIDTLDATALSERPEGLMASVRPDELLLTDATGAEASVPMPDDAFYVSFAPYVDTTHECYFHSLTTCVGELQGEQIDVVVTDSATGEVLVDETMTTFDNGFVGMWLPRDIEADVTVEHDGLSASTTVSTSNADDATCITTMQLA
ncbi:CueP family metal-binding protein [Demequina muriae]|uniref:CueP family metal-binding protein n=1 Tax=Demequina muriae TaxID=3051664 RepID=A0ABT8GIM4_9MICO|nr:CueP family metal-binding protein [Demequina sp. EGI L300058]MDN4481283.1 CueP family metal-binding protein [Demequina sp. EGI L300058]